MGKRKSSKPAPKRKKYVLGTEFDCPFCNYSGCVEVRIFKKKHEGNLHCRVCKAKFQSKISPIMLPADLYCLWMDACEAEKKRKQNQFLNFNRKSEDEADSLIASEEEKRRPKPKSGLNSRDMSNNYRKKKNNFRSNRRSPERASYRKKSQNFKERDFSDDQDDEFDINSKTIKKENNLIKRNKRFREDTKSPNWAVNNSTVKKVKTDENHKNIADQNKKVPDSIMNNKKNPKPVASSGESDVGSFLADSDSILSLSREKKLRKFSKFEQNQKLAKLERKSSESQNLKKNEDSLVRSLKKESQITKNEVKKEANLILNSNRRRNKLLMSDSESD